MTTIPPQRPPQYPHHPAPFLSNGSTSGLPQPAGVAGLPPNNKIIEKAGVRVLCIADVRGHLRTLNELAKKANADYILHTGDFGFYDDSSLDRIADKTLRHVAQYSPLLDDSLKKQIQTPGPQNIKQLVQQIQHPLSELPLFLSGKYTLDVPVYTVWGACEDVRVLEKFRSNEYKINNLHIVDEASSRLLDVGGVKLRLLGLGGAVVMHKLFDNGEGRTTIAGGQGTMWTTLLQMGELVDTANRVYDPAETRIFITHNSPAREGLLNQLSVTLKADFSISAGLHFRYGSSYNEFSVNPSLDHYRGKLASSKASFNDVWETVKGEVSPAVQQNSAQQVLLDNALQFVDKMPTSANGGNPFGGPTANAAPGAGQVDEAAFKNMWNFNLADAAFGWLVLEIEAGRIGTEMKAQGFNFSHRGGKQHHQATTVAPPAQTATPTSISPAVPAVPLGPRNKPAQQTQQPQLAPAVPHMQAKTPPPNVPSPSVEPPASTVTQAAPAGPVNRVVTPAPVDPPSQEAQKPANSSGNGTGNETSNTTVPNSENPVHSSPAPVPDHLSQRASSIGLHITNVESTAEAREIIPEEDRGLILNIEERVSRFKNRKYWKVFFESEEITRNVLRKIPIELSTNPYDQKKPFVKELEERSSFDHERRGGISSDRWNRAQPIGGGNTSESDNANSYKRGNYGRGKSRGGFEPRGGGPRGGRGKRGGRFDGGEAPTPAPE